MDYVGRPVGGRGPDEQSREQVHNSYALTHDDCEVMPEGELPDGGLLGESPGARLLLLLLFKLGQQEAELICKMSELGIFKGSLALKGAWHL
jgi:hypothetical protein